MGKSTYARVESASESLRSSAVEVKRIPRERARTKAIHCKRAACQARAMFSRERVSSAKTQMAHTRPRAPASDAIASNWGRAHAFECYLFPLEYNRAIGPRADCNRCARRWLSWAIAPLVFECALAKGRSRQDACRAMVRAGRLGVSGVLRAPRCTHIMREDHEQ